MAALSRPARFEKETMSWNRTIAWISIAIGAAIFGFGYGQMLGAGMAMGICGHSAAQCNKTDIVRLMSPLYYFDVGLAAFLILVGIIMLRILSASWGEPIRRWLGQKPRSEGSAAKPRDAE
jgi:hypothetical protein